MGLQSNDMMKALMNKLYETITGNGGDDASLALPRSKFVTWLMPGIPFSKEDFNFCAKGLIGDTAEETNNLYHQAFVLSKLFDFVPEISNDFNFLDDSMQQTLFSTTQDSISSVYSDILKYSKVVNIEPTDEEKAKIEKFRNLLTIKKEVKNIVTDEVTEVTQPGPVTVAYNTMFNEYLTAVDEYVNLLIDAQSAKGNSEESIKRVAKFNNSGHIYKQKVALAKDNWVAQGYKNEFENMNAYINQVSQKSMLLYKRDLMDKFESARLSSATDGGSPFYYTTLLPGNFAESKGWTEFGFTEMDSEEHLAKSNTKWAASGGAKFGMFGAKVDASGNKSTENKDTKVTDFKASFEFTQIPICRPFFDPGIFTMRGWTLDEVWNLNFDGKTVSDGKQKPEGRLVAYPLNALFVRNVKLTFSEAKDHFDKLTKELSVSGSAGWGPVKLSGSYSKSSEVSNTTAHMEGNTIVIPDIQYIGSINHIFSKVPDTNPEIDPSLFV